MRRDAFIYDAVRTPRGRGKSSGRLYEVKPIKLLATVLNALIRRNGVDTARVDDIIMGIVNPLGEQGSVVPKVAASFCHWADSVSGLQLNRFCASGLEAVNIAAAKIIAGQADMIIAGGVESMSRVPMGSDGGPWCEDVEVSSETSFVPQGISADLVASVTGISREEADSYAMTSQDRAGAAISAGIFSRSLIPVQDNNGLTILGEDELVRSDTTREKLAALKPSFRKIGEAGFADIALRKYPEIKELHYIHTSGNSSAIADGASAVLVGNEEIGRELGLAPRARIAGGATLSREPTIMLTAPAPATMRVLQRQALSVDDVDLFECNEAFAAVVLRFARELQIPLHKINVNGGAIALGHPLGATGGMLVGTLLDELERRSLRRGVATLCAGGGMGIATLIECV